jgi:Fur family peroxide stress response transcriptional regulator
MRASTQIPEAFIAEFVEACRQAGLADTPQRRVIYAALAASEDHPTAESVYLRVKPRVPRISLATVYRNLKLFAEAGIIEEVATGSSFARYDANRVRHHHLVCNGCGSVADHYSDDFDALGGPGQVIEGFEVHDLKVNVFGLCASCRAKAAKQTDS